MPVKTSSLITLLSHMQLIRPKKKPKRGPPTAILTKLVHTYTAVEA